MLESILIQHSELIKDETHLIILNMKMIQTKVTKVVLCMMISDNLQIMFITINLVSHLISLDL